MSGVRTPWPVWVDDRAWPADRAHVPALDAGLRSGLGTFTTLRAHRVTVDGARRLHAFDRAAHLDRVAGAAAALGIPTDRTAIDRAIDGLLAQVAPAALDAATDVALRVTLTAGPVDAAAVFPPPVVGPPTLVVTAHPAPELPAPPVRAVTVARPGGPGPWKTTSWAGMHLARRAAVAAGADVALLTDGDEVLEADAANLLVVRGRSLTTPPADGRILAGTTRAVLLALAASVGLTAGEAPVTRGDLRTADAVLLCSSVAGVRAVVSVDGRATAGAEPVVAELSAALAAAVAAEADRHAPR